MAYRTILVGLDDSDRMPERAAFALALAERHQARLIGILVNPLPFMPTALGESAAYAGPEILEAQEEAAEARPARVQAAFQQATATGTIERQFVAAEGGAGETIAEYARTVDLTIVGQSHGDGLEVIAMETAEQVVVGAGGPVLVLPHGMQVQQDFARSWLLAWDGGREASRALGFALPFLQEADRVVMVAAGSEYHASADAAALRLAGHGVRVELEKLDEPEGHVGDLLLAIADTKQCGAIAMGAYGHSRFRELITGGTTLKIVRDARLPVLFSA
ncbi:MAG TPA: universal stress protein [Geminicoccus sp.]|uniref:universal stress protein n=1 Tax=Geminicoccus sp. TaxID=2024832 RepID=UPI002E318FC3|nr:universal stress protein [Geminicoccus sp.]HEX2524752.1 universal stress protein [Geminicoccus sp.]